MIDLGRIFMLNSSSKVLFSILICGVIALSSCHKRRYPCPGNGQTTASSLSKFDEDGNLKEGKGRKKISKNDRGLVNKKQDDRLKNRRKTSLDDKPKKMKK